MVDKIIEIIAVMIVLGIIALIIGAIVGIIVLCFFLSKKHKEKANNLKAKAEKEYREKLEAEYLRKKEIAQQQKNVFQQKLDNISSVSIKLSDSEIKRLPIKSFPDIPISKITSRTNKEKISDYVVIDLETTGLNPVKDEIIQISAIRFCNFEPLEKITTFVKPNVVISQEITNINHITNEDVENSPSIQQVIPSIVEFIGNSPLVGHNILFDLKFLYTNGFEIFNKRKYFDTCEIAKRYSDLYNRKLGTVAEYFGISAPDLHRSDADAYVTGIIFKEMIIDIVEG